jgi:hypothetical protein
MGFSCVEPIHWALRKLQIAQTAGLVVGAIAGLALALTILKKKAVQT